jgi:hypothetical protein
VSLRNFSRCPCTYYSTIHPTTYRQFIGLWCILWQCFCPLSIFDLPKWTPEIFNFTWHKTNSSTDGASVSGRLQVSTTGARVLMRGIWECNVTDIHSPTDYRKNRLFEDTRLMFIWAYTSGDGRSRWWHKTSSFRNGNSIKKMEDIVKPYCGTVRISYACMLMHRFLFRKCALTS